METINSNHLAIIIGVIIGLQFIITVLIIVALNLLSLIINKNRETENIITKNQNDNRLQFLDLYKLIKNKETVYSPKSEEPINFSLNPKTGWDRVLSEMKAKEEDKRAKPIVKKKEDSYIDMRGIPSEPIDMKDLKDENPIILMNKSTIKPDYNPLHRSEDLHEQI